MTKRYLLQWLAFCLSVFCISSQAQTIDATKSLNISGLKSTVTVRSDGRGIPYIEADNDADLYFAQGYITASDRLWQMDLYRRVAGGETAEIFGNATLEEDKRWRKFGFSQIVKESFKNSTSEVRAALENYARGVNAYIAGLDAKTLPVEFQILQYRPRNWEPTDSILIGKILSDGLSSSWRQDLVKALIPAERRAEMFDPYSNYDVILFGQDAPNTRAQKISKNEVKAAGSSFLPDSIAKTIYASNEIEEVRQTSLERIGFYAEHLAASNNWVISGKRTIDGKPLLANDPHLQASQPSIWYLVNLSSPTMRAAGVSLPGAPGVVLGHNENFAWGATNVGPDVQDLYLEEFDPNNPSRYKTPDGWANAVTRREEIKVRKSPVSTETEIVSLDVVNTRNGVIYFEDQGKKYALNWTAFDPKNNELDAFYYLNHSVNWEQFKAALKTYGGAMQNFIYADKQGNIGWYAAGRVPLRKTGDGSVPYNGSTSEGDWTGYIPFDELPHLYNPPQGYIVTANQRTVGTSYKYHDLIARIFVPFRAARLNQLVSGKSKVTADDMAQFQYDTFSILNSVFAKEIVARQAASAETIELLKNWDGRMTSASKAAVLVNEIRNAFRKRILEAAFGAEITNNIGWANEGNFIEKVLRTKPKSWLPKEFSTYDALLKTCEADALQTLAKRMGTDREKWTWGEYGKIRLNHPLAGVPLIGAQFAIPALPLLGSGSAAASPNVGASVSMRLIATPGNWDATRQVIPTGESGNPNSPHWKDQIENWYSGNTPVFPFSKAAVQRETKEIWILQPK